MQSQRLWSSEVVTNGHLSTKLRKVSLAIQTHMGSLGSPKTPHSHRVGIWGEQKSLHVWGGHTSCLWSGPPTVGVGKEGHPFIATPMPGGNGRISFVL